MKRARTLLAWLLVLSLSLGLAITTTGAEDTPLTVTSIVETSTGDIEVSFSEPIVLSTTLTSVGVCKTNAEGTVLQKKFGRTGSDWTNDMAKWERSNAASISVSEDGYKLIFNWDADPDALDFAREDLSVSRPTENYKLRFHIRDHGTSVKDGYIDMISAKSDPNKKLAVSAPVSGFSNDYFVADIQHSDPYVTGVERLSATSYRINFSEAVNVASGTRPTIRVINAASSQMALMNRPDTGQPAQWIGSASNFTVADDHLSMTVKFDAAWVNKAIEIFSTYEKGSAELYICLLEAVGDTNAKVNTITAVDNSAYALADQYDNAAADFIACCVTELMYPKVVIGDAGYDTVTDALKAATSGQTVKLNKNNDCVGETLVVPAGVTLDLNGKNLTAANVVSFGDVIDSVGGGTLVMSDDRTEALLSLLPSNSMLPLYDATAGGYQFFSQTLVGGGPVEGTTTSVKFGVQLSFTDTAAYELLKSGQVKLGLDLEIVRDGNASNLTYIFKDETVGVYADSILANSAGNYYIVLQLSGLEAGDTLNAVPMLETADGKSFDVKLTADSLTYTSVA